MEKTRQQELQSGFSCYEGKIENLAAYLRYHNQQVMARLTSSSGEIIEGPITGFQNSLAIDGLIIDSRLEEGATLEIPTSHFVRFNSTDSYLRLARFNPFLADQAAINETLNFALGENREPMQRGSDKIRTIRKLLKNFDWEKGHFNKGMNETFFYISLKGSLEIFESKLVSCRDSNFSAYWRTIRDSSQSQRMFIKDEREVDALTDEVIDMFGLKCNPVDKSYRRHLVIEVWKEEKYGPAHTQMVIKVQYCGS